MGRELAQVAVVESFEADMEVIGVARNWRIRHKLILGMGLIVVVLALLLGGTLKGLSSYKDTMRTIGSKLEELEQADFLRATIKGLAESSSPQTQVNEIPAKINDARLALEKYSDKLNQNLTLRQDPDYGFPEMDQVKALEELFVKLEAALKKAQKPVVSRNGEHHGMDLLRDGTPVRAAIDDLIRTSGDLNNVINREIERRIYASRHDYKLTLGFMIATSIGAVVLMAGLLQFFYRWVFYPIRDLQLGVGRIAQGDFEHRLDIRSGDEIEDLAKAFNDMTGQLREMYRDLAQQVNERSRQLVRSERLAGVGFLAAGVAHEINNPLASIAFCSEAIEHRLDELYTQSNDPTITQDREIVSKYLKMIQEEAFRCKEITQKLLAFSRGGDKRREPTDLNELVQSVLDIVQHLQNRKGKDIVFERGEKVIAWVNAQEIKQVFLNLVVNALDSMEEGGSLRIQQFVKGNIAELVFRDTGCGMSEEVLENIFEPFFTRSLTGKGTGLGLSISHRIITQHGGEIEATSDGINQGSKFVVRIPLEQKEMAEPTGYANAA